jgi:hypothetical protein
VTLFEPESLLLRTFRSRRAYLAILGLCILLGVASEAQSLAGADIAFLLYAAGRVVDGARLYRDVLEINPPLIIVLNIPAVLLGRALGVSEISAYRFLTTLLLSGSLLTCAALLRRMVPADQEEFRRWVVVLIGATFFLVGSPDYGQREHLLLALTFPYLLLAAARVRDIPIPPMAGVGIGMAAGVGFSLKPHFLLLLLGLELARGISRRRWRPSVEFVALAGTLVAYAAGILLLAPEYVPLLRLLGPEYLQFLRIPFSELLLNGHRAPLLLLALLLCIGLVSRARHPELWVLLLVSAVMAFIAGAAQEKGWRYHFYPAWALTFVLFGTIGIDARIPVADRVRRLYASLALAISVTGMLWFSGLAAGRAAGMDPIQQRGKERLAQLAETLRGHRSPGGLFALSFVMGSGFPLVNYTGIEWVSRFPHLWLLVALYHDQITATRPLEFRTPDQMSPPERFLNDVVYEDLAARPPGLLLVLRHARDARPNGPRRIDYLAYFARDPRTADLLRNYRYSRNVGEYQLYERIPKGEPRPDHFPGTEAGALDLPQRRSPGWNSAAMNRALSFQVLLCAAIASLVFWYRGQESAGGPGEHRPHHLRPEREDESDGLPAPSKSVRRNA